ncbi:hypothetical protein GCM10007380_29740 [Gottfriedia solisilvae]|uniref:Uncharacterized protein n=1 Tax=Gottfriedia solisilvae TaxID=1516104 RepID=A0A8J3F0R1_9BACI|nr:hypothetical protein [Gottfriedia solisilvae]GGI15781.1 hypothetical protein GCM10007380_29740 [Gottfriedia solisilvae]
MKLAHIEASLVGQHLAKGEALKLVDRDHEAFKVVVEQDLEKEKINFNINRSYKHASNVVASNCG